MTSGEQKTQVRPPPFNPINSRTLIVHVMAPRQVFPYDEGGGALRPSSRHLLVDASRGKWGDDQQASVENAPPSSSGFAAPPLALLPLSTSRPQQQHSSSSSDLLHDALNDDDDVDDDGEGSVDLGSTWASGGSSRDFVPKRGVEIFVGGLTRSTRRDMLRDWFQHAGEVTEVRIARDKRRRRCRGYGYVRFATGEQADRAIDTMHRFEFKHGRFLGVLPSDENRTLFVGGLREEWSCEYISQLLKEQMVRAKGGGGAVDWCWFAFAGISLPAPRCNGPSARIRGGGGGRRKGYV